MADLRGPGLQEAVRGLFSRGERGRGRAAGPWREGQAGRAGGPCSEGRALVPHEPSSSAV